MSDRHGAGTYQMLWDCRFCGTEKLLGVTHRHCPNCGAAQDPAWRYFPAEEDMVAVEDHKYVGADKICPACSQPNSAANTYCTECGADLATGKTADLQAERVIGTGRADADTRRDVVKDQFVAEMQRVQAQTPRSAFLGLRTKEWGIIGGVVVLAAIVITAVFAFTYRQDASGQVSALTWQRTVEIQDYQPYAKSGWDETVPADAYGQTCDRRERGKRQVPDGSHQECKDVDQGDGSFRRECKTVQDYSEEPVYDQWCTYTVDRWDYKRKASTSGEGKSPPPDWPQVTLASGSGRYGEERVGARHETYTVVVRDDGGETHECAFEDQSTWDQYEVGTAVTLKLYITGGADCDSLAIKE